jgi:mannose-1-phosphate guanylyltransferase
MKKESTVNHLWLAVIAGGQGTRLFPLSHDDCPKQFCDLDQNNKFIQATVKRFTALGVKPNHVVVVTTNDRQTVLAAEQLTPLGVITPNIYQISPDYGYAGAMIKAAEFISAHDPDAIIINTPADQYIEADVDFADTMKLAVRSAKADCPTIVGVKVSDLVTFMGCGHALYDPEDDGFCKVVRSFVEKPDEELATQMMRDDNSACNTGINVWSAEYILEATSIWNIEKAPIDTDDLMSLLGELRLAIGSFKWYDCGTLKSLYAISKQTPNHKNATLGKGFVDRGTTCRGSLFYSIEGVNIWATNVHDAAVVVNEINGKIVMAIVALEESQLVRELAENFKQNEKILMHDYSIRARNNLVTETNCSDQILVGFVGVTGYVVTALKRPNGEMDIVVSRSLQKIS